MTPDQLALGHLVDGDVEGAVNVASRQAVSPWVSGCVKLAKHKFGDASAQFFADGRVSQAVAALLLDPWDHFARLSSTLEVPKDLRNIADQVISERLLNKDAVAVVKAYIPPEAQAHVDVACQLVEFNVLCIAKVAETISMATLQQAVSVVGDYDAEQLMASLINSGRVAAKIDLVAHTVEFCQIDQSTRQTAHLLDLFGRVERLNST